MVRTLPGRHRLTATEYRRMGDAGILPPNTRVELIQGEIIDMAPIGSRHAGTVEQIAARLRAATATRAMVRTQQPVSLDEHSEPEPDIAVVTPRDDYYKSKHPVPSDILLIVEVADASLRYDLDAKVPLYAKHGIREVWVVDLERQVVSRYRDPRAGAYATADMPPVDAPIAVTAMPGIELRLDGVLSA